MKKQKYCVLLFILIFCNVLKADISIDAVNYYQRYLSPLLPFSCIYHPTCSSFMKEAVGNYGFQGLLMGVNRLQRCNLWADISDHTDKPDDHLIFEYAGQKDQFVNTIVPTAMSVLLPGMGFVYHGKISEGIFAFLSTAGFAALTYECISKKAWGSGVVMGSFCLLFYSANIYGTLEVSSKK
ncbi:MAG: membrane protein insertion efficiency factor YidD [Candidatus Goldbacteria bacterium]|nr:membrane protein insertion efficiency factor YidD [Candidatus Goldiibacteriota bacterium]